MTKRALTALLVVGFSISAQAFELEPRTNEENIQLLETYCGGCHSVPSPSLLPKKSWPSVVDIMADLADKKLGRQFIPAEDLHYIKAIYYGSSAENLPVLPYIDQFHPNVQLSSETIGSLSSIPQILDIKTVDLGRSSDHSFLVCDGEKGEVILLEANAKESIEWQETVLADIELPITTRVLDFTGNGRLDILVAGLGELPPTGNLVGKIYVLLQDSGGQFTKHELMDDLGRVTDVQALDLNNSGHLDLVISVFGGGDVGEVFWMENMGNGDYQKRELLTLSGSLNITPVDLNGDGRMDLVSFVAQEHETIIAFINQGRGQFDRLDILSAGHPLFGGTSMIVEDLNQDGRPDIIFTNGDAFDTQPDPKPYHGVQWLENKGNLKFAVHDIGRFYGAAKVAVGDMNDDGHLDIVASSWHNYWGDDKRQSLIWFENDGAEQFRARPISNDHRGLVPVNLVDLTGNGRLDIVTGAFRMDILKDLTAGNTASGSRARKDDHEPGARLLWFKNEQAAD